MEKTEYYIHSTNGKNRLHVIEWKPEGQPRAIVQISHGMSEYVGRYDRFASFLADNGFVVTGNDHLGHGQSVKDDGELGYFPAVQGSETVVNDLYKVTRTVRAKYPGLPFIMFGHSMGSFLARRYIMTHGQGTSGAVLMGTGLQPDAALKAGRSIAGMIGRFRGDRHISPLLQVMAFGSYAARIHPKRTDFDWLSRNKENVDRYISDKYCGFPFTVNGFLTLFDVLSFIQKEENIRRIPKDLPVMMVSGGDDPVGHYGKDVKEIAGQLRQAGLRRVEMRIYPDDRHELLNEDDYARVQQDILTFIESCLI